MTSSNLWETDLDEFETTGDGMKNLRDHAKALSKALREANKSNEALTTERDSWKAKASTASLDQLTANLPANVKKFLTKDFAREGTDISEASVKTWLDENAADFGYDPSKPAATPPATPPAPQGDPNTVTPTGPVDPNLPPDVAAALATVQAFEAQQQQQNSGANQEIQARLAELDADPNLSPRELYQRMKAMGVPVAD